MPLSIAVVSGTSRLRYATHVNHAAYCQRHAYDYHFDITPKANLQKLFFHKVPAIKKYLAFYDWVFWIDDDAAFMQHDVSFEDLVPEMTRSGEPDLIFCKSPTNRGFWTHLSSGNFFIRNTPVMHSFLNQCAETSLGDVKPWWNSEKYGTYTGGDQDVMVYLIEQEAHYRDVTMLLPYERFNTRPFHFSGPDTHFLVHFTKDPGNSKAEQISKFSEDYGLDEFLLQPEQSKPFVMYHDHVLRALGKS